MTGLLALLGVIGLAGWGIGQGMGSRAPGAGRRPGGGRSAAGLGATVLVTSQSGARARVPVRITEHYLDYHDGQHDMLLVARALTSVVLGHLSYSEFRGEAHINLVEVEPSRRRQGVGQALVEHLYQKYGRRAVRWGYTTDEGRLLRARLAKDWRIKERLAKGLGAATSSYGSPRWREGTFLHGSSARFARFRPGGHQAIYFSDPNYRPGRKTQAEHIAEGPFGGWLAEVKLRPGVEFNPYMDPRAKAIVEAVVPASQRHGGSLMVPYELAPDLLLAARPFGYNRFEFYESSVHGPSTAVTDPGLIEIVRWHRRGRGAGELGALPLMTEVV